MGLGERKDPSSASDLEGFLFNVEGLNDARTLLADIFSILLDIWNLPVNRSQPRIGKIPVDM